MLLVLGVLCLFFSVLTLDEQPLSGAAAARALLEGELAAHAKITCVIVVTQKTGEDSLFANTLTHGLQDAGFSAVYHVAGDPSAIRTRFSELTDSLGAFTVIITTQMMSPIVNSIKAQSPVLANARTVTPPTRRWPTFLLPENIRNVANQISVIAVVAIGMTIVIITAGIDLSVGSMIALSAVGVAWLIGQIGGEVASAGGMFAACGAGVVFCGMVGAFSGWMITAFRIPPFIATLAMMQVAAGLAYIISRGMPIYQIPDSFVWLGRGVDPVLHIPYAVLLMAALYASAHILMTRTVLGRYIYAVGGNEEAARLAGIRVKSVLLFAYALCGALAGLGGVLMTSQLKSGAPTYGVTYELYVIAAVVVGGTSLSGGEGKILGTLIGAFIIAVIQNGMNLTNVESYTQKVILGLVILGAVLLDKVKQRRYRPRVV
jgi:ribose transport system permease protein